MRYAQIDLETNICVGDSYLAGPVEAPHMILLTLEEPSPLGKIWTGESWTDPETPQE